MTDDTVTLDTLRGDMAVALFWNPATDGLNVGQVRDLVAAALAVARKYGATEEPEAEADRVYLNHDPEIARCEVCGRGLTASQARTHRCIAERDRDA